MKPATVFAKNINSSLPKSKTFESKHWEKVINGTFREIGDVIVISASPVTMVCATFITGEGKVVMSAGHAKCRLNGPMRLRDRFSKTRGIVIAAGRCLRDALEQHAGLKQYAPIIDMYVAPRIHEPAEIEYVEADESPLHTLADQTTTTQNLQVIFRNDTDAI